MGTKIMDLSRMQKLAGILTEAKNNSTKMPVKRNYVGVAVYGSPDDATEDLLSMGAMIDECQALVNSKALIAIAVQVDDASGDTDLVKTLKEMNKLLNKLEELHVEVFDALDKF